MLRLALVPCLLIPAAGVAQHAGRRPLTHDDLPHWKSIADTSYSSDGKLVAYALRPAEGDGVLVVRTTQGAVVHRHERGRRPSFTEDGRYLVFTVEPTWIAKRAASKSRGGSRTPSSFGRGRRGPRRAGPSQPEPSQDGPKSKLAILKIGDSKPTLIENVRGFRVPKEGPSIVVYQLEPKKRERGSRPARGKRSAKARPRSQGSPLVVRDLASGKERRFERVKSYGMFSKRRALWFVTAGDTKQKEKGGLHVLGFGADAKRRSVLEAAGDIGGVTADKEQRRMAFFFSPKKEKPAKPAKSDPRTPKKRDAQRRRGRGRFAGRRPSAAAADPDAEAFIYLWDFKAPRATRAIAAGRTAGWPKGKRVSRNASLTFSKDGSILVFGVAGKVPPKGPDIHPDDKVDLDLWHWNDPLLQPMQARQASRERRRTVPCAFNVDAARVTVLGDDTIDSVRLVTKDGNLALAQSSLPYAKEVSWDGRYSDYYRIRTSDGSRRPLLRHQRGRTSASTTGRWLLFFDSDEQWHSIDLQTLERHELTAGLDVRFGREDQDTPQPARSYGVGGWVGDDRYVLIYDRYDVWRIAPDGSSRTCLTDGAGRASKTTFRAVQLDRERDTFDPAAPLLLSAFDNTTKASGFFRDTILGVEAPHKLVMLDKAFGRGGLQKAKKADRLFFRLSTFRDYPNLWTSNLDFTGMKQLSDANPQQSEFRWGDAELVHWDSADGIPLDGILIKPDGFDPSRKYPMLVYMYEKLSRGLHSYKTPAVGTSPNASYYVSNGYLFFMPDIVYREGYPGESCLKCVVPGVLSLVKKGFVKRGSIGIAGHSWGGYQSAYLATRTNLFAAIESGAPVSNMTSAYGGIRWQSGMSRMFQYEKTQSRIGGTLWEYPMRYIENSPVFAADKVETPILMLHNDKDGAVPWYQGIEFFVALRRLGKEAYMADYVGEPHGLRRRANQRDWTRRMQEFFDHHLRGHAAPDWMKHGIRYVDKAREKWSRLPKRPAEAKAEVATAKRKAAGKPAEASSGGSGQKH